MGQQSPLIMQFISKPPYLDSMFIKQLQLQLHKNVFTEAMGCSGQSLHLVLLILYYILQCHWHPGMFCLAACVLSQTKASLWKLIMGH